ncbi:MULTISPECIES: sporulation transcription factor Spo0A [unclassified Fusibacter]|uniref:sporulation transcription factor Spo0A n=1 Tax=unclassified Fusibacter TaxID=2624464 RepID=UPI001013111A|nr:MULTISPECIES: sporulation transcription factor Spo0A [unclassified Fusibacter]MCK8058876.1 sporulation transcription factor Spo0A [Fusibacter sp. A2]NPE21951.1 sporulation transcription factor Spo0A [Fusibacter sp. A1]RXV61519.1 sporulation transcription factor Spo0A [Fusibacter sp. A1]
MKKKRVVIADDNKELCALVAKTIGSMDCFEIVGIAFDGADTLEQVNRLKPDILILDIIMPVLDGLAVMEALKKGGKVPDLRIIILSATGQDDITFKAMNLGAAYYMMKPFDEKVLKDRIMQFGFTSEKQVKDCKTKAVNDLFRAIGIPPHTKGHQYIKHAIALIDNDMSLLNKITTSLYPKIARQYETTASRVERAIRNTILLTLERGDLSMIEDLFGSYMKQQGKLTNSEFIGAILCVVNDIKR